MIHDHIVSCLYCYSFSAELAINRHDIMFLSCVICPWEVLTDALMLSTCIHYGLDMNTCQGILVDTFFSKVPLNW